MSINTKLEWPRSHFWCQFYPQKKEKSVLEYFGRILPREREEFAWIISGRNNHNFTENSAFNTRQNFLPLSQPFAKNFEILTSSSSSSVTGWVFIMKAKCGNSSRIFKFYVKSILLSSGLSIDQRSSMNSSLQFPKNSEFITVRISFSGFKHKFWFHVRSVLCCRKSLKFSNCRIHRLLLEHSLEISKFYSHLFGKKFVKVTK